MRLNLETPNPGIFFPWPEAKTDKDGGVTIRACNNEALTEIENISTVTKKRFRGNAPYDDVKINQSLRSELLWDYCIVDWTNLQDEKGKDIPCTKKTKIDLMNTQFQFSIFVADCLEQLNEFKEQQEETKVKNS